MEEKRDGARSIGVGAAGTVLLTVVLTFNLFLMQALCASGVATAALSCDGCHDYPPQDAYGQRNVPEGAVFGSHGTHAAASGYSISCAVCHAAQTASNHQDGKIQMAANIRSGSYSKGTVFAQSNSPQLGNCSNTYCHSNGVGGTMHSGETRSVATNTSPLWKGSAACGSCHGFPPNYANGSPKANAHLSHALMGFPCSACHVNTVPAADPNTRNHSTHVNGIYDTQADAGSYVSYAYQYDADGSTCSNVSCHGNRQWGGATTAATLYLRSDADRNCTPELTDAQVQAISNALGVSGSPDGASLYMSNCFGCHSGSKDPNDSMKIIGSAKQGATYVRIKWALTWIAIMKPPSPQSLPNGYLNDSPGAYYGSTSYSEQDNNGAPGRRAMLPAPGTTEENVSQSLEPSKGGYYRIAQFVSPRFADGLMLPSGATFTISVKNGKSSGGDSAWFLATLYQWRADDTEGTNFRTIAWDTNNIPTTVGTRTISFATDSAVTFAPGDRIVCEIEFYGYNDGALIPGTVTHYWGDSTSNARLDLPVSMSFLPE